MPVYVYLRRSLAGPGRTHKSNRSAVKQNARVQQRISAAASSHSASAALAAEVASPGLSARRTLLAALTALMIFTCSLALLAQTTVSTGMILGTVTDPTGAVVSGAKITITNRATGQPITTSTTSAGVYVSGALIPGDY